ncbi:Pimeloyl-ACP methyl ester carboxylesterase [Bradyrhizobium sp. Ghvi]|uniref:alpha/beta fold hydrolase n=1 Tax=Bradyrhizobium sp. Ghvi TaxID=1855319 RepID=UPI0008F0D6D2|nr:alpha/beta hydrolase family protein [Bradyrhizobium sp. Ghvi]SFO19089.1 Pimeloyl-ACP methyl ester carboxylesterase [Bradyrhizobium sp. Ghvi]
MNPSTPRTFVLVHGAGHGGWSWKRVRRLLAAKGHEVFTPTLTGVGERSHLLDRGITLHTHVDDVVNLFKWEDIRDAVLVGHSYAGWVITGATEHIGERLAGIVYIDAFLPEDGQRPYDVLPEPQQTAIAAAMDRGDLGRPGATSTLLRIQKAEDAAWVDQKMTPHPLAVTMDRLKLTGAVERVGKKLFVRTPQFASPAYDAALERCKNTEGWRTMVLHNCGHDPQIDCPEVVSDLLEEML